MAAVHSSLRPVGPPKPNFRRLLQLSGKTTEEVALALGLDSSSFRNVLVSGAGRKEGEREAGELSAREDGVKGGREARARPTHKGVPPLPQTTSECSQMNLLSFLSSPPADQPRGGN